MATSHDAISTKVYAANLNYFEDKYAKVFLKNKRKMFPIINRGTWARVQSYRQTISNFINKFGHDINILSLGAGFDTTFFWLCEQLGEDFKKICYIEVDYE